MNTFANYPLHDAQVTAQNRDRFRRDAIPLLTNSNSLYIPLGKQAARGWVVLRRSHYDQIDKYSTTLEMEIGDPDAANNVGVLLGLSIVQAQCVTTGVLSDPNALYLVELTDTRGILNNEWFQFPLTAAYNIRAPAYPGEFYEDTLNVGVSWTWVMMLRDMWERVPLLGTWPGLPSVPTGTPEGFWFTGVPAWPAMCDTLAYIGMTIVCDLTQANPYTIVNVGADDAAYTLLQGEYRGRLEDDQEWIDNGAGRVPGTVVVLFRRRNEIYGTEETVRRDSLQWATTSFYKVTVVAPALFSSAVGTHHIWSDFTVRYDMNSLPLAADVATATTIAQERVQQYYNQIYRGTLGYMSRVYTGALPFVTGSQVDGVCWYHGRDGGGWRTKIVRGCSIFSQGKQGG